MSDENREPGFHFGPAGLPLDRDCVRAVIPASIETKAALLAALQAGLRFPDYFGHNWDALWDCITDLSWLAPVPVALLHEDLPLPGDRGTLKTYLGILQDAVVAWTPRPEHDLTVVFPEQAKEAVLGLMRGADSPSP